MSQHDYIISNATFPSVRTDINSVLSAINTSNSGTSRPSSAVAGTIWLDTSGVATAQLLKLYDGADDILLGTINFTANTIDWADSVSEVSLTGTETLTNKTLTSPKINEDVAVTSTATELNLLDGVSGLVQADLTKLAAIDATAAEIDTLDGLSRGSIIYGNASAATTVLTKGTVGQVLTSDGTDISWGDAASGGTSWQSVQTTGFTASAGNGYPCNTTSSAFTITLPASASVGDTISIVDYAGTFATNAITLNPNGLKLNSGTGTKGLNTNREAVTITYIDTTQGWVASSGTNYGTQSLDTLPYSIDFLVVAGGGGGGTSASSSHAAGAGGAGGFRTSTQTVNVGTAITVTVGNGGAGGGNASQGNNGSDSSISGSSLTTITSTGGGGGGRGYNSNSTYSGGNNGGSGGGGGGSPGSTSGGTGNTPSTSPSQGNNGGGGSGGGGGASATGGNGDYGTGAAGGNGTASSITGSSVTYAGGGGGGGYSTTASGIICVGGTGGGGNGGNYNVVGDPGTVNTGGGGGGGGNWDSVQATGGDGGKGVVILSMPDANYSGTTTGSPTVATGVSGQTVLTFTGTGSYTG